MIQRKVISFAYPFGEFDARIVQLVAKAGYKFARTSRLHSPFAGIRNPLSLPVALSDYPLTPGGNILEMGKSTVHLDRLGLKMFLRYLRSKGDNPYKRMLDVVRAMGTLGDAADGKIIISMMHPLMVNRCNA